MANKFILVEKLANISILTLNRPEKRNALNGPLVAECLQALKKLAKDVSTHVLIIQGNGENFCAGGDLGWMQTIAKASAKNNLADAQMLAELFYNLYHFPNPTIALAHGVTLGGGLGLLSTCDIVISANNASFGFSEVKVGITPSTISPYVIKAIGERIARYYFLTGERFDAGEAYRIGLIQQIVNEDNLLSHGAAIAKRLLLNSPNALKEIKSLLCEISSEKITPTLAKKTAKHLAKSRTSADAQEGLQAFIEKRQARWEEI